MNLNEYALEWIDYAERDFDTAVLLMSHQRQYSACERLTPFGTVTRYPQYSLELTEDHLIAALDRTKAIRCAVRHCLGLDTESTDNPNSSNTDPSPRSPV